MPLLLSRHLVAQLLEPIQLLQDLRIAFSDYQGPMRDSRRVRAPLHDQGTAVVLLPGRTPSVPAYTVKVHAKFPSEPLAIQGVILLYDLADGRLLAVIDSTYITAVRTALVGALAADVLAPIGAHRVAVIGAGVQGEFQLRFLRHVRPISQVAIYDINPTRSEALRRRAVQEFGIDARVGSSIADVTTEAEMIVTATWARAPFLDVEHLTDAVHVTSLGSDEPGKVEVTRRLCEQSVLVCDDRSLALSTGVIGSLSLDPAGNQAELGEIIAGKRPGRVYQSQRTLFCPTGLPFQDLVAAWQVYQKALRYGGVPEFDFLARSDARLLSPERRLSHDRP